MSRIIFVDDEVARRFAENVRKSAIKSIYAKINTHNKKINALLDEIREINETEIVINEDKKKWN